MSLNSIWTKYLNIRIICKCIMIFGITIDSFSFFSFFFSLSFEVQISSCQNSISICEGLIKSDIIYENSSTQKNWGLTDDNMSPDLVGKAWKCSSAFQIERLGGRIDWWKMSKRSGADIKLNVEWCRRAGKEAEREDRNFTWSVKIIGKM